MRILVTGGAGFIGSAVIRHIIENTQHHVLNVDKLTYAGNLESLGLVQKSDQYQFSQTDICNETAIEALFHGFQPNVVMHLAAESHVDRSIDGPAAFMQTNIIGTYTLLEVARKYWLNLDEKTKKISVFIIFRQMKCMEIWKEQPIYLLKQHLISQVLHIQHLKQVQIIWYVLGIEPMVCQ